MLRVWRCAAAESQIVAAASFALADDVVWVELVKPSREEELAVEKAVKLELPTREDMAEIELSSRLYKDDGASFMTAQVLCRSEDPATAPILAPITFVLTEKLLVTIRYEEPKAFALFEAQVERQPDTCMTAAATFAGLFEAIVDRLADILEQSGAEVEETARTVFRTPGGQRNYLPVLTRLGEHQNINSKAQESLVTLARMAGFASLAPSIESDPETRAQMRSLQRDIQSLVSHAASLSANIVFLLDATLGLINIQQNEITKIFSIAAVVFLPPTLIAGIYGMNFHHLPELSWPWGYPFALALIVISAVGPVLYFRRKGWL
ncbi:MAG: magnesium transporter CorA family protein [Caulobacteraceae bacterium]